MGHSFKEDATARKESIEAVISAAGRQARRRAPIVLPDGYEAGAVTPRGDLLDIRVNTASGAFVATYDPRRNEVTEVAPAKAEASSGE